MDENRKIVIPIGTDADSPEEQTFFDTQSRKDARPVVPLSGTPKTGPTAPGKGSRKLVLLVVAVVAALAVAGTAGAYFYLSRGSGSNGPQVAVQPVAGKTMATLPWTHTPEDPVVEENADSTEQASDAKTDQPRTRTERVANDGDAKKTNKQQKRQKSGNKNADNDPDNPIKRTQDELHRIREIFEGPP
jgi:flagellar basal body-associated protein FliL